MAFMATAFVDQVRECLHGGGWRKIEGGREEGGTFLVGYRGRVYQVDSDFQVGSAVAGFQAVGCGNGIALGALHVLTRSHLDPTEQVRWALRAAQECSAGVRGPFTIIDSRATPPPASALKTHREAC